MIISDPNLILYASISKSTTILAHYTTDHNLHNTAKQCLIHTPQFHSIYSQTTQNRSYTFLIETPFVYFVIYDVGLPKIEALRFLDFVRCGFKRVLESGVGRGRDGFTEDCLQGRLDGVFRIGLGLGGTEDDGLGIERGSSVSVSVSPLLGGGLVKKKKRVKNEGNVDDEGNVGDDGYDHRGRLCSKEGLLSVFRIGRGRNSGMYVNDLQMAKKVWRRHVVVVLVLDFFVCVVMFAIWLSVCQGFKCIDG